MPSPFPTPLPVIEGAFKIRLFGTSNGFPVGNDLCWQTNPIVAPSQPTALEVANQVAFHWIAEVMPLLCDTYTAVSCGVYDLTTAGAALVSTPMAGTGGISSAPVSIGVSALVKHATGVRKKVGKTYLAPFPLTQTDTTNTQIGTAHQAAWQTGWQNFVNAVSTDGMWAGTPGIFSILSQQTNKVHDPRTIPVLNSTVEVKLASQNRRRLR